MDKKLLYVDGRSNSFSPLAFLLHKKSTSPSNSFRFQLVAAKQVMDNLSNRLQQLLDSDPTPIREDFSTIDSETELKRVCQVKFLRYELAKTIEIFEQLQAERNDVFYTMTTVRKNEPR